MIVVLYAATTISHQLTPFWLLLAIGLLVVSKRMRPWWILPILAAISISFLLYNFDQVDEYTLFSGNIVDNAKSNVPTVGSIGQRVTSAGGCGCSPVRSGCRRRWCCWRGCEKNGSRSSGSAYWH